LSLAPVALGALGAIDAHVDGSADLGNELEEQTVLGLHVGDEVVDRTRPRRISEAHVLLDQQSRDRPDVEVRQFAAHHVPVDAYVARELAGRLDAERCARIALQLLTPNALVRTADPEGFLVEQPPDGHRVGPSIAPQRGEYADEGLLQEPFE